MSKKCNIIIVVLGVISLIFGIHFMSSGVAFSIEALSEKFVLTANDAKDSEAVVERLSEALGEDLSSVSDQLKVLGVAYYMLLAGVIIAAIGIIGCCLTKFKSWSELMSVAFIIAAIAGIIYTTFQKGLQESVNQTLGFFGGFVTVDGAGNQVLWVNGVLLIISAFLTILKTKTKGE